jgi:riboflavin synthase
MFSGIIETMGQVLSIDDEGTNRHFTIQSSVSHEAYIDQSIAHNGVCLTVTYQHENIHRVTAIHETLDKTNLRQLRPGDFVNIERAVQANSRMDGHFVQGHVDTVARCINIDSLQGSWYFYFETDERWGKFMVPKGSICLDGVSLTLVDVHGGTFSVAIIPYTFEHTNFSKMTENQLVNIEFDILGKYVIQYLEKMQGIKT